MSIRRGGGTSRPPNRRGMEKGGNKVKIQTYSREMNGRVVSWTPWSALGRAAGPVDHPCGEAELLRAPARGSTNMHSYPHAHWLRLVFRWCLHATEIPPMLFDPALNQLHYT